MTRHSVNNNTRMGLVVSLFKFRSFDQFNTPKLPQILDIHSIVALWFNVFIVDLGTIVCFT